MLQGIQLFLKNVVLAPNADVRSFYDSDQTFVDAKLAPLYGVTGARVGLWPSQAPGKQRTRWHLGPGRLDRGPIPVRPHLSNPTRDFHPGEPPLHNSASASARASTRASWSIRRSRARQQLEMHRAKRPALDATRCSIRLGSRSSTSTRSDSIGTTENGLAIDATGSLTACPSTAKRSSAQRCAQEREGDHLLDAQLLPQRERPRGR